MSRKGTGAALARSVALAALLLGAASCDQDEGDRCEVDSDCGAGLECRGGDIPPFNGTCQREDQPIDTGVLPLPQDAGTADAFSVTDTGGAVDGTAPPVDALVSTPDAPAADIAVSADALPDLAQGM